MLSNFTLNHPPAQCQIAAQFRCHYGPCPPCRTSCGSTRPCSHMCLCPECHDPAPPPVPAFQQPVPPKPSAPQRNLANQPPQVPAVHPVIVSALSLREALDPQCPTLCPPCEVPVPVACIGGHGLKDMPCHAAGPYSCEAACGRPLACGNHVCKRLCHLVAHDGSACDTCDQRCSLPRADGCTHDCPRPCHSEPCDR